MNKKLIVGVSGASGAPIAVALLEALKKNRNRGTPDRYPWR